MRWPPLTKQSILLENFSFLDGTKRFEVEFSGRCVEALRNAGLEFKVLQEMNLSLRGAKLVTKKGSASNTLPIVLKYAADVALEILPKGQGPKIDTFLKHEESEEPPSVPQVAWFLTPKKTSRPALVMSKEDLRDIDEESSIAALSPSRPEKSTSSPLQNIGNSLPAAIPPRQPAHNPPISSSSSSRPARLPVALTNVIHPPASSAPKDNPPTRKDPPSGPPKIPRPSNTSENYASTSKPADRPPAAATPSRPFIEKIQLAPQITDEEPVLSKKQRKSKMRKEKKKAKANLRLPGAIPSIPIASTTSDPPGANPPSTPERTPPNDPTSSTVVTPVLQSHHQPRSPSPRFDQTTTTESDPAAAYQVIRLFFHFCLLFMSPDTTRFHFAFRRQDVQYTVFGRWSSNADRARVEDEDWRTASTRKTDSAAIEIYHYKSAPGRKAPRHFAGI
ncbi:hypothetical protein FB451DRAFT_1448004 [Mycena latifolia]|nr:hypothetical protein FB451DRAFT_1448004 [Mycena latifolia]